MYVCHVCMVYIYVHMQVKMCTCVYLLCVVGIYVHVYHECTSCTCVHVCDTVLKEPLQKQSFALLADSVVISVFIASHHLYVMISVFIALYHLLHPLQVCHCLCQVGILSILQYT